MCCVVLVKVLFGGGVNGSGMMWGLGVKGEWSSIFCVYSFLGLLDTVLSFISVAIEGQTAAICEYYMMQAVYQHPQKEKHIQAIFHQPQICTNTPHTDQQLYCILFPHRSEHQGESEAGIPPQVAQGVQLLCVSPGQGWCWNNEGKNEHLIPQSCSWK